MNEAPASSPNFHDRALWLIVGLALLMRWAHLAFIAGSDLVRIPIIDSAFYHQWGADIAGGELIGHGVFFMSPLYPYFLGLIYSLFGVAPLAPLIVQSLLGAATVGIFFLWAERLMGRKPAIVSGVIAALYAPFIFYDATILTSSVILFFSAAILYLTHLTLETPTTFRLVGTGVLVGLSALARPLVLIFLPFFWVLLHLQEKSSSARRFGLALIGVAVILLPVSLRNLFAGGEFALTTSSAGMNFYVGNNPDATGLYWEAPFLSSSEPQYEDEDYRRVASEAVSRELTTREAGSYWARRSLDWIINEPVQFLTVTGKKILYFWNRAEFANNVSIYLGRALSPVLKFDLLGFWLIAPIGLAGLIFFSRQRGWKESLLPWAWIAAYFAGGVIFFVSSEYRLPAVLALIAGAGYFLTLLYNRLHSKLYEPALNVIIVGLLFMPLVNFRNDFIVKGENPRMDWFNIGNTLMKYGEPDAAAIRFQKSIDVDPSFAEGLLRLAEAYYRAGKEDKAIEIGQKAGLPDPESILKIVKGNALQEAYALLGEGKLDEAAKEFAYAGYDSSVASAETTRVSLLNQARAAYTAGKMEESLAYFRTVAVRDTAPDPSVFYNIAFLHWQAGRNDSARANAERVLSLDSLNVPAGFLLVRVYNAIGMYEEAYRLSRKINPATEEREEMLKTVRSEMDNYEAKGDWKKALETYGRYGRTAVDIAPEDKYRIGRLQISAGNYETALRLLTESEAGMINDPKLPYYQGLAFQAMGKMDDAMASFNRSESLAPTLFEPRMALARIYLARKQADRAFKELDGVAHLEIIDGKLKVEFKALMDSVKAKI